MQNCNTHTSNSDDLNYNAFTSSLKKVFHIHSSKCRIICTNYLVMYSPVTLLEKTHYISHLQQTFLPLTLVSKPQK